MAVVTQLQNLQYEAIDTINRMVECKGASWADRFRSIELVRAHLEARAQQVKPRPDDISYVDQYEEMLRKLGA